MQFRDDLVPVGYPDVLASAHLVEETTQVVLELPDPDGRHVTANVALIASSRNDTFLASLPRSHFSFRRPPTRRNPAYRFRD